MTSTSPASADHLSLVPVSISAAYALQHRGLPWRVRLTFVGPNRANASGRSIFAMMGMSPMAMVVRHSAKQSKRHRRLCAAMALWRLPNCAMTGTRWKPMTASIIARLILTPIQLPRIQLAAVGVRSQK